MRFDPTSEQAAWLDDVRQWIAAHLAAHADQWEGDGAIPPEALRAAAALPPFRADADADTVSRALALEGIAAQQPSLASVLAAHATATQAIRHFGSPETRRLLENGLVTLSFQTVSSSREGEDHIVDGELPNVINGGGAAAFLVCDGSGAFLVSSDAPGVERGPRQQTLGLRAADVRSIRFQRVKVPSANHVGTDPSAVARDTLAGYRIAFAAIGVGIGRGALERAIARVEATDTMAQQTLAAIATEIEAARVLVLHAAQEIDRGTATAADAARAKLAAGECAVRTATAALQIAGAAGGLTATGLERFYRDAMSADLEAGSADAQRSAIAGALAQA